MSFLTQLDWRFATKKFDTNKKVAGEDLGKILEAIRKAPTSFGIQPFHVFVVTDPEIRKEMRAVSWDQAQVTDASAILVFAARTDLSARIDAYGELASGGDPTMTLSLKEHIDMMHASLDARTGEEKASWAGRQTYIALGFGLAAAAELGIDSCPMEGFDGVAVDKILGVPPYMHSLAYLAIGYRKEGPVRPKVRFPIEDLFTKK